MSQRERLFGLPLQGDGRGFEATELGRQHLQRHVGLAVLSIAANPVQGLKHLAHAALAKQLDQLEPLLQHVAHTRVAAALTNDLSAILQFFLAARHKLTSESIERTRKFLWRTTTVPVRPLQQLRSRF